MIFFLGVHRPAWLADSTVPLFVSRSVLKDRKTFPRASCRWALDSGGFTALKENGRWGITTSQWAQEIRRYRDEIGNLSWAAPMDYMCEPEIVKRTGLSVAEHQHRTLDTFLELRAEVGDVVIPVLQGWRREEYVSHAWDYCAAGVNLRLERTVGVGSICRRGQDSEIVAILRALEPYASNLHAFGVRSRALAAVAPQIASADSMAWSYVGRRTPTRPDCWHPRGAKNEANCLRFALEWRAKQIARLGEHHETEFA